VQRYGVYCFGADPDETEPLADGPWVRADEAEAELAALRAELSKERAHAKFASDEHGKADAECEALRAELVCIRTEAELTETRLSEARAEVERQAALLDMCSANFDRMIEERDRAEAAETRLAAATELLDECARTGQAIWPRQARAFLAAQPAAPVVKCPAFCQCADHQPAAPAARADLDDGCA
jgi:hypothetical protein